MLLNIMDGETFKGYAESRKLIQKKTAPRLSDIPRYSQNHELIRS